MFYENVSRIFVFAMKLEGQFLGEFGVGWAGGLIITFLFVDELTCRVLGVVIQCQLNRTITMFYSICLTFACCLGSDCS